jgi:hypothetical protein
MNTLLRFTFLLGMLLSCSKDSDQVPDKSCLGEIKLEALKFPQTWTLIKVTGSMINSETTGTNMPWQESIALKSDGTFTKSRNQNNQITEASGTYAFMLAGSENSVELTLSYQTTSSLIGSCYGSLVEKYYQPSICKLLGTWSYCDGPGLEYEKQ